MKKNNKYIFLGGLVVVVCLLFVFNKYRVFEDCKQQAKQICEENGVYEPEITISYYKDYNENKVYKLYVEGSCEENNLYNIYNLVKNIDALGIADDDILLLSQVELNGHIYSIDLSNSKELICGNEVVYTYVSDSDRDILNKLKDELPYLGMREEFLECTSLGKADSIENCRDFYSLQSRKQYRTYTWEKTSEHGWYEIVVEYRMYRSHRHDDYQDLPTNNGYVDSISYIDENGQRKTEYYVDTY